MPIYGIVRHPRVKDDLFRLVDLVESYAGVEIAEKKLHEIEQKINSLREYPHQGSLRHDIHPNLRAIPVAKKGVLCFTVNEQSKVVNIICIAYAGSNWQNDIQDR